MRTTFALGTILSISFISTAAAIEITIFPSSSTLISSSTLATKYGFTPKNTTSHSFAKSFELLAAWTPLRLATFPVLSFEEFLTKIFSFATF